MNKAAILLLCATNAAYHVVHPFQVQTKAHRHLENNQPRRLLTQVNVGFGPQDWSDVKPNEHPYNYDDDDKVNSPPLLSSSKQRPLNAIESLWTKYGMIAYVAHMCAFLPLSLVPTFLQTKLGMLSKSESEHQALQVGQKCAQTLLQWIPFMNVEVTPYVIDNPTPAIWVSNHVSMLDTFVFLATDDELRGVNRRPIKTIYWKGLNANPICKILFGMAGFIPIDMADNGNGNPNVYNRASFKQMLKDAQQAIEDGFDILILPEGQLNPTPEEGLQPILPGAYALAKGSKRPIQMVGLYGMHKLWHADERIGMKKPVGKDVKIRAFPLMKRELKSSEDFIQTFSAVVGAFGSGQDLSEEELNHWLN